MKLTLQFRKWFYLSFAFIALMLLPRHAFTEEGGAGHYMPGSTASFIDALPGYPSIAVENVFTFYDGDVSGSVTLPVGGRSTLGLDATAYSDSIVAFWETPLRLLGGNYACGVAFPFIWMDAQAQVVGPLGNTFRQKDSASGLGDIELLPFILAWTNGPALKYDARLCIFAPSGDYDVGALANVGKNYWTFEPALTLSYLHPKTMWEISAFAGMDFNTVNEATDYQTGIQFHIDSTVAKHWPLFHGMFGIGANGFYYQQITDDSGSGASVGDFSGRTVGVGPVLSYVRRVGKVNLATEVKWLPELETKDRLKGDYVWFKVALVF